tara:strand:- start:1465 stop:2712 length:1248 start_codon:yes stop_codon:yes gene_type:complete
MLELINPNRFDLIAKYLYIKNYFSNNKLDFYIDLYKNHIITFNKGWEYPGNKTNIDDFINSFDNLIESIKHKGFDNNNLIEVDNNNNILNGAHRLMICYYLNIKPNIRKVNKSNYNLNYNYDFFLNRNNYWRRDNENYQNLPIIYSDTMALEYIKIKTNVRTMILYPISYKLGKRDEIEKIINKYGVLYYKKRVNLNKNGVCNLIKELYRGEKWIGGMFPNNNCGGKFGVCYSKDPTELYVIDFYNDSKVIQFKKECRDLFNLGKHSLHISDDNIDTFRIGSSLLNENSIYFLNNGTNNLSNNTKELLVKYFNKIGNNNEDYCLTSSLIMELFNLRNAKDIDYLHISDYELSLNNIGLHSGIWEKYYHISKKIIIYNPKYHFYFNGYKFTTLNIIKKMKENRGEEKDLKDIKLIG